MSRLRTFMHTAARRRLALEAALALAAARVALDLVPFARLGRWLGPASAPGTALHFGLADGQRAKVEAISRAIATACRRVPFNASCLTRVLAGHAMCRWRGIACVAHFGAVRGQVAQAETHAWLDAGEVPICGYPLPPDMVELGCFPSR